MAQVDVLVQILEVPQVHPLTEHWQAGADTQVPLHPKVVPQMQPATPQLQTGGVVTQSPLQVAVVPHPHPVTPQAHATGGAGGATRGLVCEFINSCQFDRPSPSQSASH